MPLEVDFAGRSISGHRAQTYEVFFISGGKEHCYKDFAAQMEYLSKHGCMTASIDQVAAAPRGRGELPPWPIVSPLTQQNPIGCDSSIGLLATIGIRKGHAGQSGGAMDAVELGVDALRGIDCREPGALQLAFGRLVQGFHQAGAA